MTPCRVPALLGAVTVLLSACGSAPGASDTDDAVAVTCELAAVAPDDPPAVARRFDVELHGTLHDIADARTETDRGDAGRLLVAKNRVESLLAEDPVDGPALARALEELAGTLAPDDRPPCP